MPVFPSFLTNPTLRRWILQVLGLLLLFGLLALGIWLFYEYKIREIEQRRSEPPSTLDTSATSVIDYTQFYLL